MPNANAASPANKFDPKSATYYDDLHKAGFISGAQLQAVKSKNEPALKAANKEVFNQAKLFSRMDSSPKKSETIDSGFLLQQDERSVKLKEIFTKKGYDFVKNSGKNNNCLIISLLQHFTGNYQENHDDDAKKYRDKLNTELKKDLNETQKKAFKANETLTADPVSWLLKEMAKDTQFRNRDLTVELWMANEKGEPVSFSIGNGKQIAIILQSGNHFEAVLPPKKTKAPKHLPKHPECKRSAPLSAATASLPATRVPATPGIHRDSQGPKFIQASK